MPAKNNSHPNETELIKSVKKTLKILAKVIKDKEPGEIIKEIEPKDVIGDGPIAEIIKKTNFMQRIKDFDPDSVDADNELEVLVDELTSIIQDEDSSLEINAENLNKYIKKLAQAIRERLTPDLPGLNPKDEGAILGHLGPSIFAMLTAKEE
jgi:hypothetical protein